MNLTNKLWLSILLFAIVVCAGCSTKPSHQDDGSLQQWMIAQEQAREQTRVRFREAITKVLAQDSQTQDGGASSSDVVARMEAIETIACPDDFRSAYLAHAHAWQSLADAQAKRKDFERYVNSGEAIPEAILRWLLGDPTGKPNEMIHASKVLDERVEVAHQAIHDTWDKVTEVSMSYGASVPSQQ